MPVKLSLKDKVANPADCCWEAMTISARFIKYVGLGVAVALAGLLGWVLLIQDRQPRDSTAKSVEAPDSQMTLSGIEFTEIEQDQKRWTLRASEARYLSPEQKTELKDVHLVFHLKDGKEIHLESREGVIYAGTKNIELRGAVRAMLPRDYQVTTEQASYNHEMKTISSESAVQADGPEVAMVGGRWEYQISEERATIAGGVQATLKVNPFTISLDHETQSEPK